MPTRAQVRALLAEGQTFQAAGRALGIPAGRAFMIATGLPADRSSTPDLDELAGAPVPVGSTQSLVNPAPDSPTRDETVAAWVAARAGRELKAGS